MANLTLAQIRLQLDQISAEYDARFAGQSRVTRDLNDLNSLTRRAQQALQDLEKLPKSKDRTELEGTARDAINWLILMREELGPRWTRPDLFRIGASSLLGDIERQLEHHVTGRYSAANRHMLA